jgi:hypothetical protein
MALTFCRVLHSFNFSIRVIKFIARYTVYIFYFMSNIVI